MSIIFKYVNEIREDGSLQKAPYIPVYLRDKNNKLIKVSALVDSGADSCVIPKDLAIILGLKEGELINSGGIGGNVLTKKSKISLNVKNNRENYNLILPSLILQEECVDIPLILGRNGFFENFHIIFKQKEGKLILKKF